ncbi:MAG TPA: hypothetical protein VJP86_10170 [Vicinamibacterales bacterium]|jgi:hypothetical protein|nr:hypothetical protein [Vicinamibacterales bacterium]
MARSGRDGHRSRETGSRGDWDTDAVPPSSRRVFRITDEERQNVARALRYIDDARRALADQQNPINREIIRELRSSADRIYDVINGLEEIGPE